VSEDSKLSVEVQPSSKSTGTSSGYNSPTSTNSTQSSSQEPWQLAEVSKSILEDPFDAEWAAIASRNANSDSEPQLSSPSPAPAQTNPFLTTDSSVKAFELQL